jgi:hypothetical protein
VLTADTTVTWSLSGGSNSDYRLTKVACWPLSLNRHELGKRDSDAHLVASRARRLPVTPFPIGAPAECHPRLPFLQGTPGPWTQGRGVPGGIRTRNPPGPRPGASTCWATSTWSRHPVPTRVTRCTRAGPQPCAAAKLAILASNQETPGPEPGGSANSPNGHQVRKARVERAKPRGMPVPFTPA